jgi:hypothetical protein
MRHQLITSLGDGYSVEPAALTSSPDMVDNLPPMNSLLQSPIAGALPMPSYPRQNPAHALGEGCTR